MKECPSPDEVYRCDERVGVPEPKHTEAKRATEEKIV